MGNRTKIQLDYNIEYENYATISTYDSTERKFKNQKILWPFRVLSEYQKETSPGNFSRRLIVEFVNKNMYGFNTIKDISISVINKKNANDDYLPTLYGVGCIGKASTKFMGIRTPEYTKWHGINSRCHNINDPAYRIYGAAGVKVFYRWLCLEYFIQDIQRLFGYQDWVNNGKTGFDIDRVDSNGNYEPDNCRLIPTEINGALVTPKNPHTGFYNVYRTSNGYGVSFCGKNFGVYDSPIIAASLFNKLSVLRFGPVYGKIRYNEGVPDFSYETIRAHQINNPPNIKHPRMYNLVVK